MIVSEIMNKQVNYKIADISLAEFGREEIELAKKDALIMAWMV